MAHLLAELDITSEVGHVVCVHRAAVNNPCLKRSMLSMAVITAAPLKLKTCLGICLSIYRCDDTMLKKPSSNQLASVNGVLSIINKPLSHSALGNV